MDSNFFFVESLLTKLPLFCPGKITLHVRFTGLLPRDVFVTHVRQVSAHNLAFLNLIIFACMCGLLS